jgi:hypothetical protein
VPVTPGVPLVITGGHATAHAAVQLLEEELSVL